MLFAILCINTTSLYSVRLIYFSDLASLMNIEKAITSGSVLVLHNVNENVDSIFLPLIYRINTNTKDGVCDGEYDKQMKSNLVTFPYLVTFHASTRSL